MGPLRFELRASACEGWRISDTSTMFDEPNKIDISFSLTEESNQQNNDEQNDNALNNIWAEHKDKFKEWILHKRHKKNVKLEIR